MKLIALLALATTMLCIGCFYAGHYTRTENPSRPHFVFTKPPFPVERYAVPVPTKDATFVTCYEDCYLSGILTTALVVTAKGSVAFDHVGINYDGSSVYASYGILMPYSNSTLALRNVSVELESGTHK